MKNVVLGLGLLLVVTGCDEKMGVTPDAANMLPATVSATASAAPSATTTATATASATATAASSATAGPSDTAEVAVTDPVKDPAKTALVNANGTVNLYLPKWAGTTWAVKTADKALPKQKEEMMPGFVGTTPATKFTWKLDKVKAGSYKVDLTNTNKDDKSAAAKSFTLTIEIKG